MAQEQYTLELVIKALDQFSGTLNKLQAGLGQTVNAQNKTTSATADATASLGKLQTVMQNIVRGNFVGAFESIAGSLGPIGGVAVGVVGTLSILAKVMSDNVEATRRYINEVDDLADRYKMTTEAAGQLLNLSKIFDVSVDALGRTFRTMARQGLQPSIEGLIKVKEQLDTIPDPARRTAAAYQLLGRGAMQLADLLATNTEEIRMWATRAAFTTSVTTKMTDAQDKYNRTLGWYKALQTDANVVLQKNNLNLVQQVVQSYNAAHTLSLQTREFFALTRAMTDVNKLTVTNNASLDQLAYTNYKLRQAQESNVVVTGEQVSAWLASSDAAITADAAYGKLSQTEEETAATAQALADSNAKSTAAIQDTAKAASDARTNILNMGDAALAWVQGDYFKGPTLNDQLQADKLGPALAGINAQIDHVRANAAQGLISQGEAKQQIGYYESIQAALLVMSGEPSSQVGQALAKNLNIPLEQANQLIASAKQDIEGLPPHTRIDIDVYKKIHERTVYWEQTSTRANEQFGTLNLREGVYNVGEAGTEGLIVRNGRISIIAHHEWLQSGMGAGRPGFMTGIGDTGSANPAIAFAGLTAAQVDYMTGGGGGGAKAKVKAAQTVAAAHQAAKETAAVVAQAVQAVVPSSAALGQAVTAPVVQAAQLAATESKRTNEKLDTMISVLRGQGTVADNARAVRDGIVLSGQ